MGDKKKKNLAQGPSAADSQQGLNLPSHENSPHPEVWLVEDYDATPHNMIKQLSLVAIIHDVESLQ